MGPSATKLPNKYAVVKLPEVLGPGQSPYKCVPKSWLQYGTDYVILPYPLAEQLPLSMKLMIDQGPPVLTWPSHLATLVCEIDTYEQGLIFITHLDDSWLEEYAILKWREISQEFRAKQSQWQRQPGFVLLRVMEWFRSFFD